MTALAPKQPWMATESGRAVSLSAPLASTILIDDVAAHLAKICRFAGATQNFYSVAQHSVLVAEILAPEGALCQLHGLLHDAAEAYIGDVPGPVKALLGDRIQQIENAVRAAVHEATGLEWPLPETIAKCVHYADMVALATEKRDLLNQDTPVWGESLPAAHRRRIRPWAWPDAAGHFLEAFRIYKTACGI